MKLLLILAICVVFAVSAFGEPVGPDPDGNGSRVGPSTTGAKGLMRAMEVLAQNPGKGKGVTSWPIYGSTFVDGRVATVTNCVGALPDGTIVWITETYIYEGSQIHPVRIEYEKSNDPGVIYGTDFEYAECGFFYYALPMSPTRPASYPGPYGMNVTHIGLQYNVEGQLDTRVYIAYDYGNYYEQTIIYQYDASGNCTYETLYDVDAYI